jgi:hypothetical protein
MSKLAIGLFLTALCASSACFAQDAKSARRVVPVDAASGQVLELGVAHLAAKAAFSPQTAPSRQELLGILLVMSMGSSKGRRA